MIVSVKDDEVRQFLLENRSIVRRNCSLDTTRQLIISTSGQVLVLYGHSDFVCESKKSISVISIKRPDK